MNDNLKWNTHIDHVPPKISRIIGLLNQMKMIFPQEMLISIYITLILPHLNYCMLSWAKYCEPLTLLQNVLCVQFVIPNTMPIQSLYLKCAMYLNSMTYKLLIFYCKLLNNNTSSNFFNFKSTISKANEIYIIRSPKSILPSHNHNLQIPSTLISKHI